MAKAAKTALATAVLVAAAGVADGAITLGTYTFTNFQDAAPSSVATGMSLSNFTAGSGATRLVQNGSLQVDGINQDSLASAVTANDYVGFTITPTAGAGYRYTLSAIKYDVTLYNVGTVTLESSVGGFGATTAVTSNTINTTNYSFSLPPTYTNLTEPTEFRFYSWNGDYSLDFKLDNVSLTGDTQALASLLTGKTDAASRVMQNTSNVRTALTINNDALTAGSTTSQTLDWTAGLSGATGVSLNSASGTGLASGSTSTIYANVDTSTTGLKVGGTATITGTNTWRTNTTAGVTHVDYTLGNTAVVGKRTVTGSTLALGRQISGINLSTLGSKTLTLTSTGDSNNYTSVTAAGNLFDSTESFNPSA
ncbi:MAG: hypothetical protein WCK05_17075, partial [Planctomycetota bacterium]